MIILNNMSLLTKHIEESHRYWYKSSKTTFLYWSSFCQMLNFAYLTKKRINAKFKI